ncbi:SAM-dependent methyltransferase [Deinococcus aquaedulcis]|uniref:hypothetical protein n=1 Tax=Deinococcus aquaedulcis TaxID=2840455 RepID=UPI001C82E652|nr:hypothetical protein [Deinococcus aquaedulcis]
MKYRLDFDQNRWHASVQGCVRFSVPLDQEERVLSFCSTPHRLDRTQGRRWRFLPDAREPELRWIAKEFRSSYTRKLWPFLQQISSPAGLLAFMVNEYQPSQLASANVLNPFRSAALVLESRLPPEQAAQALARLSAAEHAFRIRWAARQGAPPT